MKKTIMIDGRNLSLEKGTGVATYARNLSYCLRDLGHEVAVLYGNRSAPGQNDLMKEIAFFDSNAGDIPWWLRALRFTKEAIRSPLGYEATSVPITGTVVRDTFKSRLPYFDALYNSPDLYRKSHSLYQAFGQMNRVHLPRRPDLMHWTYPLPLRISRVPNVYTLHDLVPLRLPYTTLDNKRRYLKMVRMIAHRADHIVTVSESARQDIMSLLKVPESRVTNTYQSVSIPQKYSEKTPETVEREIRGAFGLDYKNYYLFWGSIEPKKNVGRIIEGFLCSGVKAPLVIVGAQAWKSEDELKLLYDDNIRTLLQIDNETRVKRKIIQLNYAPFPLLVSLIKGAKGTLFPSLYEGFGLPVLESMLLGTPVISSTTASIPEVAGDAAILVDPYDTQQLAQAIRTLDQDEGMRDTLIAAGHLQARKFSPDNHAQRLRQVYDQLL
jgi:glycosyltransferase involved in cell wall biosynthesis